MYVAVLTVADAVARCQQALRHIRNDPRLDWLGFGDALGAAGRIGAADERRDHRQRRKQRLKLLPQVAASGRRETGKIRGERIEKGLLVGGRAGQLGERLNVDPEIAERCDKPSSG